MKKLNLIYIIPLVFISTLLLQCQSTETVIRRIYSNSSQSDASYHLLEYLCKQTPGRLPGTTQSVDAINYLKETMQKFGADSVWLFPVQSSGWKEIKKPFVSIDLDQDKRIFLHAVSLGQCISTDESGLNAPVVIIENKNQIDSLGEMGLKGKIVFFNVKMKTRSDYGKYAWARVQGASMVSRYGAVGVLVRSLTTKYDDNPHTGVVRYDDKLPKIPAVALSWKSADSLEYFLENNPGLNVHLETFCQNPGNIVTYNVIGEIRGSKYPDEILLLSAHLDAWHNTEGAHDDGGGVAQVVDVLRILNELNIKPKRTIRVMPYMDEEQYNTGIIQYAEAMQHSGKKHLIRVEVDHGIGVPVGFSIQADSASLSGIETWRKYLENNKLKDIRISGSPNKTAPLYAFDQMIMAYLSCDDPHYFDLHHAANDVFESVEKENLQSGGAALATFYYLLDKYDVIKVSENN